MYLPYTTETHNVVLAADLDQLVERLSGRRYNAIAGAFEVDGNLYDAAAARRWMANGGQAPHSQVLLNALALQGIIQTGDYVIKP
ncbi:hypothetical protein ABZ502_17570 [Streptomyces abikoensis]|uniref:hypothetical protein n=1 Tax=Streptomyces abikoensis TaxID=97398 RepID=UPI0033C77A23